MAMMMAATIAHNEYWMCSSNLFGMPGSPRQCDGSLNHVATSWKKFTPRRRPRAGTARSPLRPCPRPRRQQPLDRSEDEIRDDCERHRQHDADGDRGADRSVLSDVDQVPQARDREQARDRG